MVYYNILGIFIIRGVGGLLLGGGDYKNNPWHFAVLDQAGWSSIENMLSRSLGCTFGGALERMSESQLLVSCLWGMQG